MGEEIEGGGGDEEGSGVSCRPNAIFLTHTDKHSRSQNRGGRQEREARTQDKWECGGDQDSSGRGEISLAHAPPCLHRHERQGRWLAKIRLEAERTEEVEGSSHIEERGKLMMITARRMHECE